MRVRELMTEQPATCTPETSLQEVAQMMIDCDCGAIPVVDGEQSRRPVGIITDRDITTRIVAQGQNPLQKRTADAMTDSVVTIRADEDVDRCASLMEENQVRRLVVVDGDSRCVGIVAQADLALQGSDALTGEVVEQVSQPTGQPSRSNNR